METFAEAKEMVANPNFAVQRRNCLSGLHDAMIDTPILALVKAFNSLPFCFTLQSCYGHFIYPGQSDPHNMEPLPKTDTIDTIEYRIAYLCLCIEANDEGRSLLEKLKTIPDIDPDNIQLCSAEWFWERQVNTYSLQVEPLRYKDRDTAIVGYGEALRIEKIRDSFFTQLHQLLQEPC